MARWSDEQIDALLRRQRGLPVPTVGGEQPSARWPALFQFLAGYLHQDFDINGTPRTASRSPSSSATRMSAPRS